MNVPQQAIDMVKKWEGLRHDAYLCSGNVLTIGYGTTARAGVGLTPIMGMTITTSEAEYYLEKALAKFTAKIDPLFTAEINDNERSAFISLAYNIGPAGFKRSSALRHFNAGDKDKAAKSILMWNKAGGRKVKGLVNRRAEERLLFLLPVTQEPAETPPEPATGALAGLSAAIIAFFKGFRK